MFAVSSTFHSMLMNSIHDRTAFADLFTHLLCKNGKLPVGRKKREVSQLFNSNSSNANSEPVNELQVILSSISFSEHIIIDGRDSLEQTMNSISRTKIVTFSRSMRTRADESFLPDQISSSDGYYVYELRSITMKGPTVKTVVRYGNRYSCLWMYSSSATSPSKVKTDDIAFMTQIHSNWISCHYELIDSIDMQQKKIQYLEYLGGQGRFVCDNHRVPLTVSMKKTNIICSFHTHCNRKATWNCPSENCLSSVCRKHFKNNLLNEDRILIKGPTVTTCALPSSANDDSDDDDLVSEPESDEDLFWFINFATDSGSAESANLSATDSGDIVMEMNNVDQSIPTHVLLNTDCHVLERKRFRNERSKTSSRFLQNIVASSAGDSIPLIYPNAALFPIHYYQEQSDRTMTGAVPAPLFCDKLSKTFKCANIEDHKRTAVLNHNLLQSTDVRSIQTAFDTVLNKRLTFSDTRLVLNRGYQEVSSSKSKSITPNNPRLYIDKADSRIRVNEMAALLSARTSHLFSYFNM